MADDLAASSALPAPPDNDTYPALLASVRTRFAKLTEGGKDEAEACGIGLQKGQRWNHSFRVTSASGARVSYKLDRWD